MHSHLSHGIATERNQELRRAADRARLVAPDDSNKERAPRHDRIARLRIRVARLTARFAEPGS
jgi:hypothetical protein